MPRLLRTEEDVMAVPPAGLGANTLVPAQTILQVKRRFKMSIDTTEYLQCSCGRESYCFNEHSRVNFTAVQDTEAYTLEQLIKWHSLYLPSVIQFQKVDISSIVHFGDDLASASMLVTEGPVEVIGTVQTEVLVGWVRQKDMRTYTTIVIPNGVWNSLQVQRSTMDNTMTENYLKRRFAECPESDFVDNGLYMLNLRQRDNVWLRSPKLFTPNLTGATLKTALQIDFQGVMCSYLFILNIT